VIGRRREEGWREEACTFVACITWEDEEEEEEEEEEAGSC